MAASKGNMKVQPFLRKLVDLTSSCPDHIGGWNDDGTQFIVRSSQFADLLREQFQGSLQTFVRQLHFYSFQKKDDGASGVWMFSHPHFRRGQPDLLVHIARKSNQKKKGSSSALKEVPVHKRVMVEVGKRPAQNAEDLEMRVRALEERVSEMSHLEEQMAKLKEELVQFKELGAAQNLLLLAPEKKSGKTVKEDPMKEEDPLYSLARPKKVTRLTSVDSAFEFKDFPFEDSSSIGSVSIKDLMKELQTGIFADFDEFLAPSVSKGSSNSFEAAPSTPAEDVVNASSSSEDMCKDKEECFSIPQNFQLQPGVTIPLLKQAFSVIAKICCPCASSNLEVPAVCSEALRRMCDEHPHPANLPPVELCPVSQQLLPFLREAVTDDASDLALMRAARQVYEVYYVSMMKKLQDKVPDTRTQFTVKKALPKDH
jgi:hypothetical protein